MISLLVIAISPTWAIDYDFDKLLLKDPGSTSGKNSICLPYGMDLDLVDPLNAGTASDLESAIESAASGADIVAGVYRYDRASDTLVMHSGPSTDFTLDPGDGYVVDVQDPISGPTGENDFVWRFFGDHDRTRAARFVSKSDFVDPGCTTTGCARSVSGRNYYCAPYDATARWASQLEDQINDDAGLDIVLSVETLSLAGQTNQVYTGKAKDDFRLDSGVAYIVRVNQSHDFVPEVAPAAALIRTTEQTLPARPDQNLPLYWDDNGGTSTLNMLATGTNSNQTTYEGSDLSDLASSSTSFETTTVEFRQTYADGTDCNLTGAALDAALLAGTCFFGAPGEIYRSVLGSFNIPAQGPVPQRLYGWYHAEVLESGCGDCPAFHVGYDLTPKIGVAVSEDDGLTWQDLGFVLEAPSSTFDCLSTTGFVGGYGDLSVVADAAGSYVYVFFTSYRSDFNEQGVGIARFPASDASLRKPKQNMEIWKDGEWTLKNYCSANPTIGCSADAGCPRGDVCVSEDGIETIHAPVARHRGWHPHSDEQACCRDSSGKCNYNGQATNTTCYEDSTCPADTCTFGQTCAFGGQACVDDSDCSVGTCIGDNGTCSGGTNNGQLCYSDQWCPGGTCVLETPNNPAPSCGTPNIPSRAGKIFWGPGVHYNEALDLAGEPPYVMVLSTSKVPFDFPDDDSWISFSGDLADPTSWTEPRLLFQKLRGKCVGSNNVLCELNSQCPSGICGIENRYGTCSGGTNDKGLCVDDTHCPSGTCDQCEMAALDWDGTPERPVQVVGDGPDGTDQFADTLSPRFFTRGRSYWDLEFDGCSQSRTQACDACLGTGSCNTCSPRD
ncbi:hypothetical protein ABI59_06000 [Acidobacteria bacterium Mor1]|nr:hypothetical protein ABI59_06000 [Acidobacteria bacterium Mor1]